MLVGISLVRKAVCAVTATAESSSYGSPILALRAYWDRPRGLLFLVCLGATTPRSAASALSSSCLTFSLLRWRPHKCKIHPNSLLEQLGIVGPFDGGFGLALRRVFDQDVTLLAKSYL